MAKTLVLQTGILGSKPKPFHIRAISSKVEQEAVNFLVGGASPSWPSFIHTSG
jgi:hypothetical protein